VQKKIFLYTMSVLIITLIISGFFTARTVEQLYLDKIEEKLISQSYLLSDLLAKDTKEKNTAAIQAEIDKMGAKVDARITVIDSLGKVLGETDFAPNTMENHLKRPEMQRALAGMTDIQTRYSTTAKMDYMYIAQPIYAEGSIVGVVRISNSLKEAQSIIRSFDKNIIFALIPGLILSLLLVYRISVAITKPIKEIKNAAVDITQGKLDRSIRIESRDEIGQLAKAIDFMAASLKDKLSSIKDKNTKMEAILSSVVNGIIAVDSSQNILFINPMAQKMLDIHETNMAGKHLLQIIRNSKIDNMIKNILEDSTHEENEISINYPEEKIFRLYSNAIRHPDSEGIIGIIIIIQDITEIRKLERMRSEFVANVSHELKTPLTSIKGFVETLKTGAIEDYDTSIRFLNIIEDEADRLNRLITDILSLSELESKKIKTRIEVIHTTPKINEIMSMLQNQAGKKNIKLSGAFGEQVGDLKGDPDQFKQMMINLIDNAIKYTPEGGKVQVSAHREDCWVVIKIKDNGIGIPKEHIPRLFERFYRVDKARSRNVGGTGLGLAIVKHIAMQFGGTIDVKSTLGKGTEFILTLPSAKNPPA
jgi:two-component system phosphate regulon sensor histidine kinase PhoR